MAKRGVPCCRWRPRDARTGGPEGTPSVLEELTVGSKVTIGQNDLLVVPAGSTVEVIGSDLAPSRILVVKFSAGNPDLPLPPGVSREPLAATAMPMLPSGPVRITLERHTLARGLRLCRET